MLYSDFLKEQVDIAYLGNTIKSIIVENVGDLTDDDSEVTW